VGLVSRTRCSVLHAAPQSRDRYECCLRYGSAAHRFARATRCAASGARLEAGHYFPGGAIQIFHNVAGPAWPWKNRCVVIANRSALGAFAVIHASQVGSR
jgi:hypothetical protein